MLKHLKGSPKISEVKEEVEMQEISHPEKARKNAVEDFIYRKALFCALPMDYVTMAKLQGKLAGEANKTIVCKLIDKKIRDGYLANPTNRKLGW